MMTIEIPDYKTLELEYLVVDYNGTLAVDGEIGETFKAFKGFYDLRPYC